MVMFICRSKWISMSHIFSEKVTQMQTFLHTTVRLIMALIGGMSCLSSSFILIIMIFHPGSPTVLPRLMFVWAQLWVPSCIVIVLSFFCYGSLRFRRSWCIVCSSVCYFRLKQNGFPSNWCIVCSSVCCFRLKRNGRWFDALINHNKSSVAGFVVRDCIIASAKNVGHASIIIIKALTLREGLRQALNKDFSRFK